METVMITGSCRGLGAALKTACIEHGFDMVLNCRTNYKTDEYAPKTDQGGSEFVVFGDITEPWVIAELAKVALEKKVTVLINSAGIYFNEPFDISTPERFSRIVEINLMAPMLLTRAIWPVFKQLGGGLVININSLAGLDGGNGETAYCASKHGLAGFSKALQFEGVKDNIRVLNVYLGAMKTGMAEGRPNWEKFIDPVDAADAIISLCKDYKSLRITEITIARRIYG